MAPPPGTDALRYERFFQTSGDLLCVLDTEGRFQRSNEAFHDVLGYPEETLLGTGLLRIVHPEDAAQAQTFLHESGQGDGALRVTARFLHRDLTHRRLSFSLRRVAEDAAIYGAGREVLEQETDAEARRRAEVLQKTQATAMVGGWEVDCRTNELYWTDETYRIHEVPPGFKPVLETAINFYAPESVPIISAAVEQCMKGIGYHVELQLITAKGRRLWVRAAGQPVLEDGVVVRLIGAFQDIDLFKRREIEVEEKLAIITAQRTAIRALSAPIIQVWDRVLALPVVGTLDEERAAEITGRMLDAVASHAARYAILDLTGVETVDEGTADHLVKIIRAIQLLGAQSIVTGIRPAMARTLVASGAGFAGARTVSNLREAIKIAMGDALLAPRKSP
jgi:rsbT co-antagonist protein RsbR